MLWVLITLQWYFCPWENHEDICVKEYSLMLIIRELILMVFLGGLKNCTKTEILDQGRERNLLRKDIVAKLSLVSMIFKAKQIIYIPSVCWSSNTWYGKCIGNETLYFHSQSWVNLNFVKQLLVILLLPFSSFSYF